MFSLGYMEIVLHHTAATLHPLILQHVAPGTTVNSDEWSAFRQVATLRPNVA